MNDLPIEHQEISAWTEGVEGCGVLCACKLTLDGFDTLAEAREQLDAHIEDERVDCLSDRVAARVSTLRKDLGWTRERLAGECTRLGAPAITANALTNIESGRRRQGVRIRMVTVDEMAVLSKALGEPLVFADEVGLGDPTAGMKRAFYSVARAVVTGQMDERIALAWQVFSNSLKSGGGS